MGRRHTGPEGIDDFLGARNIITPESLQQLTEKEFLGLSESDFEIVFKGQSAKVPKIVYYIIKGYQNDIFWNALCKLYEINESVYEAERNPAGILLSTAVIERLTPVMRLRVLLRLAGVTGSLLTSIASTHSSRDRGILSPALAEATARVDRLRETYAFRHLDEPLFSRTKSLLTELQERYSLSWKDIFEIGHIPLIAHTSDSRRLRPSGVVLLNRYIEIVVLALSGKYSVSEIAKKMNVAKTNVAQLVSGNHSKILTSAVRSRIDQQLKKD